MKVSSVLVLPLRHRSEVHRAELGRRRIPATWVEARERAATKSFDDTVAIGEVFDKAIAKLPNRVWRDKGRFRGVPCLHGTRIPLYQVCGMAAEGMTPKRVAKALRISDEQVRTALRFASIILEQ